jgi:hypothetical protein
MSTNHFISYASILQVDPDLFGHQPNDNSKRGHRASFTILTPRYRIFAVHTRFDRVEWFVVDESEKDYVDNLRNNVIRQKPTLREAIAGLGE